MTFKDTLKNDLADEEKMLEFRHNSSKTTFVFMSLVFFLSFFLYGASLFENFFESFFGVIYLAFLFSFVFYVYYFLRTKFVSKIKGALALILI
jgi:hypothetical protein